MTPDSIVKHLDIIKHIAAGFVSCRVNPALDPLPFEQLKEALGDRVVVTVTPSAHAATQVVGLQKVLPFTTGKLAALIRMHQYRLLGLAPPDGHQ